MTLGRRDGSVWRPVLAAIWSLTLARPLDAKADETDAKTFPVTIRVEADRVVGPLPPVWRFFGYDEPNYTYMKDGRALLGELAALGPKPVYVHTHNLLTSGDGTPALKWGSTNAYTEDDQGRPVYDWTIVDRVIDTLRDRGVRPFVQVGFMPEALSTHPVPYQHQWTPGGKASISTGWAYPPKDYAKWGELVYKWVEHSVARYGKAEVEQWYWEVWNEPNILYWRGTPEEFHKLYDYAADAVKRALPTARVGGPHVAGPKTPGGAVFLRAFLDHCLRGKNHATGRVGSPLDFVAFHAKGDPKFVDGHVRTGIGSQLRDVDAGFGIVAAEPALKGVPIIIGESDPDGCAACPATVYPQNGYRNGTLYASYTASAFARKYDLAERHGVNFEGAVTWAFEFEDQPMFAGFRVLASNGVDLPVLNVFRMFAKMGARRVAATSTADPGLASIIRSGVTERPDVSALAALDGPRLTVMVWHHHDDDLPGPEAVVNLWVKGLPSPRKGQSVVHQYRVDANHSNAFEIWKRMGSPQPPTPTQLAELKRAGELTEAQRLNLVAESGAGLIQFNLPRQGVTLLIFEPSPAPDR